MGLFESIFKRPKALKQINGYFEMLDGYTPIWSTYEGGVYEMELTRACIHTFANHASKLQPHVSGADLRGLQHILETKPNGFMLSSQFLYKTATILEVCNTCYIVPVLDSFGRCVGYYPVLPLQTEVVESGGVPYLRYTFQNGKKAAVELSVVGVLNKFLYHHDLRGDDNSVLWPTLQLIQTQNQGIEEGIKNSASFRFMAQTANFSKADDLAKERKRFTEKNFSGDGSGGLLLFPNTYTNIQQIKAIAEIVDPEQMDAIQTRVFDYFGCSMDVLQNKVNGDAWDAYYEGKLEPFAIQLSQAMTGMTFSTPEMARGNEIVWSANRLQYMTNKDKLQVSSQMFDRGIFSRNDIMDIWNLPHVPDGDKHYIRKEYTEISQLSDASTTPTDNTDTVQPATEPGPVESQNPDDNSGTDENAEGSTST